MKKIKKEKPFNPVVMVKCPRCGKMTKHFIQDKENKIYKCLICKTVHA